MTDPGEAAAAPGSSGLIYTASRALPGRVRSLSSSAPPGRLTSLRTRDLTLGGALKKPKKIFEPNVHAVRKSRDELKEEIHVAPRRERRERDGRRKESRGRRRERPQTIQSHSIFEQAPADTVQKPGWRGATDLHGSNTPTVSKPVKKERKHSEEDEDEILSKLQRDDFIDDPGLRNDDKLKPIQLPLRQSSSCSESQSGHGRTQTPKPEQPFLAEMLQELSLSGREELFFMQLPDCMPARGSGLGDQAAGSAAEKPVRRAAAPQAQEVAVKEGCPVLSQFPEGFLGKLQIRRSGKVELKLGDIVLDVCEGAAFSFLQQLVSVRLSEGRTGDMMVLGNVHHKLVLSPNFQALLRQTAAQQQGS